MVCVSLWRNGDDSAEKVSASGESASAGNLLGISGFSPVGNVFASSGFGPVGNHSVGGCSGRAGALL